MGELDIEGEESIEEEQSNIYEKGFYQSTPLICDFHEQHIDTDSDSDHNEKKDEVAIHKENNKDTHNQDLSHLPIAQLESSKIKGTRVFKKSNSLRLFTKSSFNMNKEKINIEDKNDNKISYKRKFSILEVLENKNKSMTHILEEDECK